MLSASSSAMDPLHITEFASDRYFSKLKQLNNTDTSHVPGTHADSTTAESSTVPSASISTVTASLLSPQGPATFVLPLGNPRHRHVDVEPLHLKSSEQKKRSLGHDLTALRTQRRPTLSGSFGKLSSKVNVHYKTPTIVEHRQHILAVQETATVRLNLEQLFLALPNELQVQVISSLPIHDILNMRMVSKSLHAAVVMNESAIARFHLGHTIPAYALRLYPAPPSSELSLHYVCAIWHRLLVASKLSAMIARYAVKDIFLQNTPAKYAQFEPQHRRMRRRLMPLVFTIFHFFETCRQRQVKHLMSSGTPLNRQAFTLNPIEVEVMNMYDDYTLLKVHQVWALTISSFNRRLRPPSYVGTLERHLKGYLKDRPADEVYTTILAVGGLRQAQRFWETKGYNARRAAVDTWYDCVTKTPVEPVTAPTTKSKISRIAQLGRKKQAPVAETPIDDANNHHNDAGSCNEWFCVKPTCQVARRRHSTDNMVFHSSLAIGPPMAPLSRSELALLIPDLPHLSNMWIHTAESMILQRKIVDHLGQLKKITEVLRELITEDGGRDEGGIDEYWYSVGSCPGVDALPMEVLERVGSNGDVSD